MSDQPKKSHLTYEDCVMIQHYWNDNKLSTVKIAELLGKAQSTIWRELKKGADTNLNDIPNDVLLSNKHGFIRYSANIGQRYKLKQHESREGARKLTFYWQTKIEDYLNNKGWTPEDFVVSFPKCPISASTIRNYIRKGYLNIDRTSFGHSYHWSQDKTKPRTLKQAMLHHLEDELGDPQIVKRLPIENRPKSVDNRRYFGHWEGDLVVSRDDKQTLIMVLVERKTRYTVLFLF